MTDTVVPAVHLPLEVPLDGTDGDGGALARAAVGLLLLVMAGAASLRLTLRLAGPLAAVLVALAVVGAPAAQAQETLTPQCDAGGVRDGCGHWYRTPTVSLQWIWSVGGTLFAGCENGTFTAEGRVDRACTIAWGTGAVLTKPAFIGIDRTPPTLSLTSDRGPDYNGWFNHPVTLRFRGSDATSGVAACSSVPFSGPQGARVRVSGSCRDVAGNVRTGSFPVNYDSTPPPAPSLDITPGNKSVDLDWSLAGGATSVEVARVQSGADPVLYRGAKREFVDRRRRNGVRQRYRVTAIDQAGNRASRVMSTVPTSSSLLLPVAGSHLQSPPELEWKGTRRASYYNVQLYKGDRKVLSRWPKTSRLQLHKAWKFAGKKRRLRPGRYLWYVWPGYGKRSAQRYGHLLGKRTFVIAR